MLVFPRDDSDPSVRCHLQYLQNTWFSLVSSSDHVGKVSCIRFQLICVSIFKFIFSLFSLRRIYSNFRCSNHDLMIERGQEITVFCPLCLDENMYIIEDEFHFFYECPTYDDLADI